MTISSNFTKKQKDILDTALRLFNEFGFVSVGIDRIIAEADVAKMTFYKHFPSKDKLIIFVVKESDNQFRVSLSKLLEQNKKTFKKQLSQLKSLFDWYGNWFKQADFFWSIFIKALNEFPHREILHEIVSQHKNWLHEQIATILRQENIQNADKVANQIGIILDGAIVNERLFPNQNIIEQAWQMAQNLIENAKTP